MEKVALISGVGGFIGRNLAAVLMEKGYKVAGVPRVAYEDFEALQNYVTNCNPDVIFHLAAYGNHSNQDSTDETFGTNIVKTYLLLKSLQEVDYKAFVNVSTSSVYGKTDKVMRERNLPDPLTDYACTKYAGEQIAKMFALQGDPIVTVRPFSVYGEGEATFRLMPTIVKHLTCKEDMELSALPNHDWIYVEDFINGMITVADNIEQLQGEVVNIGTGTQTSNREIYDLLAKHADEKAIGDIRVTDKGRPQDSDKWVADISKLRSFGWKPEVTLEQGTKWVFDYYKDLYITPSKESDLDRAMRESLEMMGDFAEGFK